MPEKILQCGLGEKNTVLFSEGNNQWLKESFLHQVLLRLVVFFFTNNRGRKEKYFSDNENEVFISFEE